VESTVSGPEQVPVWEVSFLLTGTAAGQSTRSLLVIAESEDEAKAGVVDWLADEPYTATPLYAQRRAEVILDGRRQKANRK
jgi:hypothetical protein